MSVKNVALSAGQLAVTGVCLAALAPIALARIQATVILAGTTYFGDAIISGGGKACRLLQSMKSKEEEVVEETAAAAV